MKPKGQLRYQGRIAVYIEPRKTAPKTTVRTETKRATPTKEKTHAHR